VITRLRQKAIPKAYRWSGVIQQAARRSLKGSPQQLVNNSAEPGNEGVKNSMIFLILDEGTRIARLRTPNAITVMIAERLSSRDDAL